MDQPVEKDMSKLLCTCCVNLIIPSLGENKASNADEIVKHGGVQDFPGIHYTRQHRAFDHISKLCTADQT
jgi:hypothetical protein